MARLGLFPLPLVLLPTERVPLHIFEPRYRELIGDCVDRDEEFGIVLLQPNGEIHDVGTRAAVTEVLQVLPDGRMNIIVAGGDRFRLLEVDHEHAYASAAVEELVDEHDPAAPADIERALTAFRSLQQAAGSSASVPDSDSPLLDFELAARVEFASDRKQALLEVTSPRLRMVQVAELLEQAQEAVAIERDVRRRASSNGRVSPLAGGGSD